MHVPRRQIFRESAIQHYIRNREKDVLLRILPLPMAVFLWVLLGILLAAGLFTWNARIPTYATGAGFVQQSAGGGSTAVVFLPFSPSMAIYAGESVLVQIAGGSQLAGKIMAIESHVMSPDSARAYYQLEGERTQLVTQPTLVVHIAFGTTVPANMYAGSSLSAQIEVGSQRILTQLPWIGQLIRER